MIQPLRTVHRRIFVVLAIMIPAVIVTALVSRHKSNLAPGRIAIFVGPRSTHGLIVAREKGTEVEVVALREIEAPDLLAYWSVRGGATAVDDKAVLLGQFVPGRVNHFPAPPDATAGTLILYSAPLAKVVDTTEIGGNP